MLVIKKLKSYQILPNSIENMYVLKIKNQIVRHDSFFDPLLNIKTSADIGKSQNRMLAQSQKMHR